MPTTILRGTDLSLTIDSSVYDAQSSSVTLVRTNDQVELDVLDGQVYKTIKTTAELQVEMLQDWGAASSLCEALWGAADTDPDTALPFTFTANGVTLSGDCYPAFPDFGGASPDVLTVSVVLKVDQGSVTIA